MPKQIQLRTTWRTDFQRCAVSGCKALADVTDGTQRLDSEDVPMCTPHYVQSSEVHHGQV